MLSSLATLILLVQPSSAPPEWTVSDRPSITIGASEIDQRQQFVRILGATTLGDGSIAVLDVGIPALRLYAPNGRWVRDLGRRGRGPGEYVEPSALAARADRVGVLERSGEVDWLLGTGRPDLSTRVMLGTVRDGGYNLVPAALMPEGVVVIRADERMFGRTRGEYRQEVGLILVRADATSDTLGWFPGDSGRADARAPYVPRPYLPRTGLLLATGDDRIAVMTADGPRVRIFDGRGRLLSDWNAPLGRPVRVTPPDVTRAIDDEMRGLTGNDERVVREWADGRPQLASGSLATRLLIGRGLTREFWIERLARPDGRAHWMVMSADGRELAAVRMPAGVELLEVGANAILGLHRDADGVETVVRHALTRR